MDTQNKNKPSFNKTKDKKPKLPSKGFWLYLLFVAGLFIFLQLLNSTSIKEISWSYLENELLPQHDIEKIVVVNI